MIREGCQKKTGKVWSFAQKFNFFQGDPVFFFKRPLEGMDNVHWTWAPHRRCVGPVPKAFFVSDLGHFS